MIKTNKELADVLCELTAGLHTQIITDEDITNDYCGGDIPSDAVFKEGDIVSIENDDNIINELKNFIYNSDEDFKHSTIVNLMVTDGTEDTVVSDDIAVGDAMVVFELIK
jgi:hypothetical protein